MSIYTCIMQIEQRTKIWSLLLVTINKILCQFFEFTQNLKRSRAAALVIIPNAAARFLFCCQILFYIIHDQVIIFRHLTADDIHTIIVRAADDTTF